MPETVATPSPTRRISPTSWSRPSKAEASISVRRRSMTSSEVASISGVWVSRRRIWSRRPFMLQSYSSLPTVMQKPPSRLLSSTRSSGRSSHWYFLRRKSRIWASCSSVGGVT